MTSEDFIVGKWSGERAEDGTCTQPYSASSNVRVGAGLSELCELPTALAVGASRRLANDAWRVDSRVAHAASVCK